MDSGTADWEAFRQEVDRSMVVLFSLVSESIGWATDALLSADLERAQRVISEDRVIDDRCDTLSGLIKERLAEAAFSPSELEDLIAILQMVPELERSADLAEHIARRALDGLGAAVPARCRGRIQSMSDVSVRMWRSVTTAYADRSRDLAFALADADDELDGLAAALVEDAFSAGLEARVAAEVALVARFYERSGDHAVNIGRRVDAMLGPRRSTSPEVAAPARRGRRRGLRQVLSGVIRLRLVPADEGFLELFEEAASNARSCAEELRKMATSVEDADAVYESIKSYERRGDAITVELLRKLDSSFVTPYDREDIHALTEKLDDVVDDMFAVAELVHLVHVSEHLEEFPDLADVLVAMADELVALIACLKSKAGARHRLEKIETLERQGDAIYRRVIARLFSGQYEALEVLRWKDIMQALENALNTIEDVSDVVESILVKGS